MSAFSNKSPPGEPPAARSVDRHGIWAPGVRVMRSISFSNKAGIITLVFLLPILLLSWAVLRDYQERTQFTQHELQGVQLLQAFAPLNHELISMRNASRALQGGFDSAVVLSASQDKTALLFEHLKNLLQRNGDPYRLQPALQALQATLNRNATPDASPNAAEDPPALVTTTTASIELFQHIADRSSLILDPEIDTLYLSLAAVQVHPMLLENLGQIRAWSTYLAAKSGHITPAEHTLARQQYVVWDANLRTNLRLYRAYLDKAILHKPALQKRLDLTMLTHIETYRAMAYDVVVGHAVQSPHHLWQSGGAVFEALDDALNRLLPTLAELLGLRLRALQVNHLMLMLGAALSLCLAVYFFYSFYRGTVRDMAQQQQDEADLRHAKQEAEQASFAKSQFLANMSHELRTPMNAILGMFKLLQNTVLTPRQHDYIQKSESAAQSLLKLLNDILDLSKIEAEKMALDVQPFRSDQLLQDLSVILLASAGAKPVKLVLDIDPALPPVLVGDDLRLRQVLINLGSNAFKFTQEGEVELGIQVLRRSARAVELRFSVRDTGIGIALAHQSKIFSSFLQAESTTTRRFGGTGLGLAICEPLVALMGGTLQLESALGAGSRFYFSITLGVGELAAVPLAHGSQPTSPAAQPETAQKAVANQEASEEGPPQAPAAATQRLHGLRILLVEDNLINQQVAQELLSAEGAHITIAHHGRQGVDAVRDAAIPFDVVLMDLQMPVLDGYDATREIRQVLQRHQLPIVAMTANAMASDREACLAAGMNEHIGKPFNLTALVELLQRLTGRTQEK